MSEYIVWLEIEQVDDSGSTIDTTHARILLQTLRKEEAEHLVRHLEKLVKSSEKRI